jgi:recombination associated protein RdgC
MGILSNSVSITQYQVSGTIPMEDPVSWAGKKFSTFGFRSIDDHAVEKSVGWTSLDAISDSAFETPASFFRKPYICASMRIDERKVPGKLLKSQVDEACQKWLDEHPELDRVPKQHKQDIRDLVQSSLLAKTLSVPSVYDFVWDTKKQIISVASISQKILDEFEELFDRTFAGFQIIAVHPFARARSVLDLSGKKLLEQFNMSKSDAVIDLIEGNRWIGLDFLLWLTYRSMESSSEYRIAQNGPANTGESFIAHIDGKVVLEGESEDGKQRLTSSGPQSDFKEVRTAIHAGKQIPEATLHFEKNEQNWKMTLKGDFFRFGSFKSPKVKLERDEITDRNDERIALFYERMHLLASGWQMFDSVFAQYLAERISDQWPSRKTQIEKWAAK